MNFISRFCLNPFGFSLKVFIVCYNIFVWTWTTLITMDECCSTLHQIINIIYNISFVYTFFEDMLVTFFLIILLSQNS